MLADYNENSSGGGIGGKLHLDVPRYTGLSTGSGPSTPTSTSGLSLSVNYLPSKFSSNILKSRTGKKGPGGAPEIAMPKQGGGLAAFKAGEQRIGGKKLKWTKFKWILLVANLAVRTIVFSRPLSSC
jgi:hypothetical protein